MDAIILAGGLGKRLRSAVADVPKPMAPVKGAPFLEHLIRYLKGQGVTKIILSVGYKYEIIYEFFGESFCGVDLVYSIEKTPLGTGGAIKKALKYICHDHVFIFNGDTLFDVDLTTFQHFHIEKRADISLALKEMKNFDRYGTVKFDKKCRIVEFKEKEVLSVGNINGGVYVIQRDFFDKFILPVKFSFEQFLEKNVKEYNMFCRKFDGYFIDIGIPEDYEKIQNDIGFS